ncbi:MAG: TerB family tellurite resistance protein [Candidatus Marinimicrobia bacterium]|nr:TerB family tellurite resistance protein [Candidatus Neomarinimicrobiota bacterium]MBL7023632.1 TerB family tellurite resistance protein [Candidatus Neomarinimicrobiota bacterium]MBL7109819.1 TerB family tellurite resistance protein [Candidatus Neomarinimicrobiota bacterium]
MKQQNTLDYQTACAALLLSVAGADEILEPTEIVTIKDILKFYFEIDGNEVQELIEKTQIEMKKSVGLFEYGRIINNSLELEDKIEFIKCVFEVAYSDGDLHYLEHHTIKNIANILNVEHKDLICAKTEISQFLK